MSKSFGPMKNGMATARDGAASVFGVTENEMKLRVVPAALPASGSADRPVLDARGFAGRHGRAEK